MMTISWEKGMWPKEKRRNWVERIKNDVMSIRTRLDLKNYWIEIIERDTKLKILLKNNLYLFYFISLLLLLWSFKNVKCLYFVMHFRTLIYFLENYSIILIMSKVKLKHWTVVTVKVLSHIYWCLIILIDLTNTFTRFKILGT